MSDKPTETIESDQEPEASDCVREDVLRHLALTTPRVIGKPGPTARDVRELIKRFGIGE